ncbi:NAD(P)-dependent oxidoreductase [Candidatus Pelagibacter sp.]|nr:NAD(P)-dependent oxidoreductase [Candidatus Pelagibacter sp.]
MNKRILIVGGTGFIGRNLAKKCLSLNWNVTSVSTSKPKKKLKKVKYIYCDISKKYQIISRIDKKYTYVVNLAGYVDHSKKKKTYQSHYLGIKNISNHFLKSKIKKFLQMGSSLEYGNTISPQKENAVIQKSKIKSVYALSKYLASNYLINLYKKFKFPVTILRLYLTYGPDQDLNRLLPIVIFSCLKNNKFDCSNGKQYRDFIYIDDLTDLIINALVNKRAEGEIINAGSGKKYNIKKIIEKICKSTKGGKPDYGKIKLRNDEPLVLYPSILKAKKILKWKPKINFDKGLDKTIKYYKKNG